MNRLGRYLLVTGMWVLGALAAFSPASGFAFSDRSQDLTEMSLEDLMNIPVVGASKYAQKLSEAPADVSIVTQEDIKKYGYRTLADILRSVRGFYVTYDRNYSYLGVRGFNRPGDYNMRILFLVDGHRLNENVYDGVLIGTDFPVDVDLIDRVEIIRGPSYALYGSGAFLAVINIITRQGRDLKGVELSGEAGSLNTFKGRATFGNRWRNGMEALFSGTYYDSQGNKRLYFQAFDNPATNYGIAANRDHDSYYSFFGKALFRDFTLTGVYHSREKLIPTASWNTVFNNSSNKTLDARAFLDLKYEHTFSNDWKLLARLYYDRYCYDGSLLFSFTGAGPARFVINKDLSQGEWWGGEVQATKKLFGKHPIVVGAEVRNNFQQYQKNYDETPYRRYMDDQKSSWLGAGYAQGEFLLPKNLRLTAGLRYDYYSTFGPTLNPRLALVCNPWEKTILKLLYGQGFRAPNVYELYYRDGGLSAKGNPTLKPEKIQTYGLVWEQSLKKNLKLTAAGFYYRINNLINAVTDPADGLITFRNAGKVETKGLEVELAGRWRKYLEGRLSYTLQEARDLDTGRLLSNSPRHLVKANLSAPFYKDKLFGGLEVLYTSPRLTLSGRRVSGGAVTNFTLLSKSVSKNWEFSASVYNLFNNRYRDPAGEEHLMDNIRQDGIGFRVKAMCRF